MPTKQHTDSTDRPRKALSTMPCSILGASTDLTVTTTRREGYIDCKLEFDLPRVKIVGQELWVFPPSNL